MGAEQYFALGVVAGLVSGTVSALVAIGIVARDRLERPWFHVTNPADSVAAGIAAGPQRVEERAASTGPRSVLFAPTNWDSSPGVAASTSAPTSQQRLHPRRRRESSWTT